MTLEMSKSCKYFVQHAWKQDLCSNCFESREEHWKKLKQLNIFVPKITANVRSILGPRDNNQKQRKNVVFRSSLTEIIGYGGDDDMYECFNFNSNDPNENDDRKNNCDYDHCDIDDEEIEEDGDKKISDCNIINSSEEDRALCNLTRSNTNFNRITANLIESSISPQSSSDSEKIIPKCFDNLMLGNIQKDSEGKKKTLLISVTPFGANSNCDVIPLVRSTEVASVKDEKKQLMSTPANETLVVNLDHMTPIPNHQLSKSNETSEDKCQNVKQLSGGMNSNHHESVDDNLTVSKLKYDDVNMENELPIASPTNASVQSVTPNVEYVEINSGIAPQPEFMVNVEDCEPSHSDTQENQEINHPEFDEAKMCEDVLSSSLSIDFSISETSSSSSIVPPKPRNSFLHGGKNNDDIESPLSRSDGVSEILDSTPCFDRPKDNLPNIEIQEETGSKLPEKSSDDLLSSIFTRKPASPLKSDCPVVREKEKRERATSCSPKFRNMDESSLTRNYHNELSETMSKRCATRSLSRHSSSSYSPVLYNTNVVEDEVKKKNKTRFSLKRLLRLGSSKKDLNITTEDAFTENIKQISPVSQFKNKPEIIHPLELDGAAVEILYHDKLIKITDEITNTRNSNGKAIMREPPPPPPTNMYSSPQAEFHQLSASKSTKLSLHDGQERTKMSSHDTDREHPLCHSMTSTSNSTSNVHNMPADSIHTGIHNFGKFRPIQCN